LNRLQTKEESMVRIIAGVIGGFFAWSILWVGSEKILSAIWPDWHGAHQVAFQAAVTNGGEFTADNTILLINLVRGSIVSLISGFLTAFIAGENKRSPKILVVLLVAFGLMVVAMSWNYVPLWYHVIFTVLLIPMTLLGGSLRKSVETSERPR
jgi:hypothetical protein